MTSREFNYVGMTERIKHAKAALNRLRAELIYEARSQPAEVFVNDLVDFAELTAIFEAIIKDLDQLAPPDSQLRTLLNEKADLHLDWYRLYHKTPR